MSHPNLSDDINRRIAQSEADGGFKLADLQIGRTLIIQTRNTSYMLDRHEDGLYIHGNEKYCPVVTKCNVHGSTWGGSMLKVGFVGIGMHLEFSTETHPYITTSVIVSIREV